MKFSDLRRPLIEVRSLSTTSARPFKWTKWAPNNMRAQFTAGDNIFEVIFEPLDEHFIPDTSKGSVSAYELSFENRGPHGEQRKTELTGTGGAIPVIVTVLAVADDFMQKAKPHGLLFSAAADEPSRVRLYDRIVPKLAEKYGFNLTRDMWEGQGAMYLMWREPSPLREAGQNPTRDMASAMARVLSSLQCSAQDVNSGDCAQYAEDVAEVLLGLGYDESQIKIHEHGATSEILSWVRGQTEHFAIAAASNPWHAYIYFAPTGKFHDAEAPQGVSNVTDLPFYQRWVRWLNSPDAQKWHARYISGEEDEEGDGWSSEDEADLHRAFPEL